MLCLWRSERPNKVEVWRKRFATQGRKVWCIKGDCWGQSTCRVTAEGDLEGSAWSHPTELYLVANAIFPRWEGAGGRWRSKVNL